jgi:cytochrome c oxidase cbb3-type subunit 3
MTKMRFKDQRNSFKMKKIFIKRLLPLAALVCLAAIGFAQDATPVVETAAPESLSKWMYHNMFAVLAIVAIIGAFGALLYMSKMLFDLQKVKLLQEMGMEAMEEVKLLDTKPWYQILSEKLTNRVPIEKEAEIDLDHEYDGIRELDNVLPPWWVYLFYATVIFAPIYIGYMHFSDYGKSSAEQYEMEVAEAEKEVKAYLAKQSDLVDETNVTLLTDESELALGETIFQTKCVACHGAMGEGNAVGPNLTDKYWLHGGGIKDVFTTIKYGVPEKGMISWSKQIRASDMQRVASYILSLQGTNPPNAKEPQGDLWEGEKEEEKAEPEAEEGELSLK